MSFTKPVQINIPLKKIEINKPVLEVELVQEEKQMNSQELWTQTKQQCEQLLKETQLDREKQLAQLQEEMKILRQQTYEEASKSGYSDGYEQGTKQGHENMQVQSTAYLNELKQQCFNVQGECRDYVDEVVEDLVPLVKRIVEKVTKQVLVEAECSILPLVQEQLKELNRRQQIFIRLHPNCYEEIQSQELVLQPLCAEAKFHFISDISLSDFGCVIETESEIIDLQIDKQLDVLFKELERVVRES